MTEIKGKLSYLQVSPLYPRNTVAELIYDLHNIIYNPGFDFIKMVLLFFCKKIYVNIYAQFIRMKSNFVLGEILQSFSQFW
jgi:hypothetical protein